MSRDLSGIPLFQKMYHYVCRNDHIHMHAFVLLLFADSSYWASCGLEILLQCPRHNERGKEGDCRASWKYELTKGREALPSTSLCPCTSEKAWVKIFLSVYLSHCIYSMYFCLHHSIFLLFLFFLSLSSLSSRTTAYSPHTRANRNFHSRNATQPGYPDKWEHAARMHTLKEALWIFKC